MNSANITEFGQAWWGEAKKKVKNAVVFLDALTCECLHWNGGAASLLDAGATCIKELSTFERVPEDTIKAVFIFSSALHGTKYNILESLIRNSSLEYCIIITAAHTSVHHLLKWGATKEGLHESDAFQRVEEDVLSWMGNLNYTVEIFNYPLSTTHPTRDVFLIPSAVPVEPLFPSDLGYVNEQLLLYSKGEALALRSTNELTFGSLPLESQTQIRQLVHSFNQLLQHINGKDEIFTVGSFSRILGTELEGLNAAKTRRKTATNKVSVIFVDRVLDLASATKCSSDNLYDRLFNTLSPLHEFSSDVAINMSEKQQEDFTVAPGCLAPQTDWKNGWKVMEHFFYKDSQQGMDCIVDELMDESESDDSLTDFLADKDWDFIQKFTHLYQAGNAIIQSQKSKKASKMDYLRSIQKSLVEHVDDLDSPSPLVQILQLIKTREESGLILEDILVLLVNIYSLTGDNREKVFPIELEDRLRSVMAENIISDFEQLSEQFQDFVGLPVDEVKAHRATQKIVEQLHFISGARGNMKKYRSLHQRENPSMPLECISFLQQLIEDIFDTSMLDNPDLEHKSGGLKDLLKTGFSLFVNVRKPKPNDPLVLLYVCGGIRPNEVKLIRDLFREKSPSHNVMIGSSHFISAHSAALHYVLKKNVPS